MTSGETSVTFFPLVTKQGVIPVHQKLFGLCKLISQMKLKWWLSRRKKKLNFHLIYMTCFIKRFKQYKQVLKAVHTCMDIGA